METTKVNSTEKLLSIYDDDVNYTVRERERGVTKYINNPLCVVQTTYINYVSYFRL